MNRIDPRTPILVGGGQLTQRTAREGRLAEGLDPIGMLAQPSRLALEDAAAPGLVDAIDTVAVVRFTADSPGDQGRLTKRLFRNPPLALARRLGLSARRMLYTATGGNTPQWLVNRTAEEIARGQCDVALLAGAEYLASFLGAMKAGVDLGWQKLADADPGSDPEEIGDMRAGSNAYEGAYGLRFPVNTYALFENALRGQKRHTPQEHLRWLGDFFSPFSRIASENPHAWFATFRSPEEIATPSERNRFVGFPYTKYLNAVIEVDMSAAVIMTSVGKAHELGIPREKWVFLHGCGDANDIWNVSERINYYSSPAIRMMGQKALAMAQKTIADMAFVDLYSCFPSAVQIGCAELGIAEDDPRGLTVTGGLPYFGGPGNDYVMHSIVTMMEKCRAAPGRFGLVTGNGWYVTKHSIGIYSTAPVAGHWQREDPSFYQKQIDAMAHPRVEEHPHGPAKIETYTVVTDRKRARFGIVIGRLEDGRRFLAHTPEDDATLDHMMQTDMLGQTGHVGPGNGANLFTFRT